MRFNFSILTLFNTKLRIRLDYELFSYDEMNAKNSDLIQHWSGGLLSISPQCWTSLKSYKKLWSNLNLSITNLFTAILSNIK